MSKESIYVILGHISDYDASRCYVVGHFTGESGVSEIVSKLNEKSEEYARRLAKNRSNLQNRLRIGVSSTGADRIEEEGKIWREYTDELERITEEAKADLGQEWEWGVDYRFELSEEIKLEEV